MRLVIMAQEEPVYVEPCLVAVLRARRADVVAVAVGPARGIAGPETAAQRRVTAMLLGPVETGRALVIRAVARALRRLGPLGAALDRRSLARAAARLGVPVLRYTRADDPALLAALRALAPDVIVHQGELRLGPELLGIPRRGVLNRHGARLPDYRGRVASFWAHAAGAAAITITIHLVDEGLDTGPIVHEESVPSDPCWSYGRVLRRMWRHSPGVLLRGLALLEAGAPPRVHSGAAGGPAYRFPRLAEAQAYLAARRARRGARGRGWFCFI